MKPEMTIADAAEKAMRSLSKPATAEEIHDEILRLDLYKFNTPTPVHVLDIQLKRHADESLRTDKRDGPRFRINPDRTYELQKMTSRTEPNSPKRTQSIGMKRIMRASDKEPLIDELMSAQVGVFREIWKLLLFAAQVGLKAGKKEALKATESGKGIDQATFGNSASWPGILYLMALAESGESQILTSTAEGEDQRVQLFQEYANGGLSVIAEFFKDRSIDLDGVLAFIETNQTHQTILESPNLDLSI